MVAFAKPMPTVDDLVVIYNAGGPEFKYANNGWDYFRGEAEQYKFIMLHNVGGHYGRPMQFAQMSRAKFAFPSSLFTDYKAMAKAMRRRTDPWYGYIGSPETFPAFVDAKGKLAETDKQWLSRAIDEIRMLIEARPTVLFFDAFEAISYARWRHYRYEMLAERLSTSYAIQLGAEPYIRLPETGMYDWWISIQTEMVINREGPKTSGGYDTGKNKADPYRNPRMHPRVIEMVRSRYVKQDVADARARGFVPAVNVGPLKSYLRELAK